MPHQNKQSGFGLIALLGLVAVVLVFLGYLVLSNVALTTTPEVEVTYSKEDLSSIQDLFSQFSNITPDQLDEVNASITGSQVSALINDQLAGQDIPAENINVDFVEDKVVASADLDLGFISGPTYLEGKIVDNNTATPDFDLDKIVVNNIELKGTTLEYAESQIKTMINSQLESIPEEVDLSKIDLDVADSQLILNEGASLPTDIPAQ